MTNYKNLNKKSFFRLKMLTVFAGLAVLGLTNNVLSFENIVPDTSFSYGLPALIPVYDSGFQHNKTGLNSGLKKIAVLDKKSLNQHLTPGINRFLFETGLLSHKKLKNRLYNRYVSLLANKNTEYNNYSPFMMLKIEALKETYLQKPLEKLVNDFLVTANNDYSHDFVIMIMQKELIDYIDSIKISYYMTNQFGFYLDRLRIFEISA